jgi:RNA polymerase-binding transcription factor
VAHQMGRIGTSINLIPAPLNSDSSDVPETAVDGDIDLAVTELKAETLRSVGAALTRLDDGTYGYCSECEDEIPQARLKAMPFAIRCRECESTREEAARARSVGSRDRLLRALS